MSSFLNEKIFLGEIKNPLILNLIDAGFTLLVLFITSRLVIFFIDSLLKTKKINEKVLKTTRQVLKNIIHVIFLVMGIFTVLEIFGVNTASLVATAGIGGVAIGFGAQSLVKDVIAGFFIILEGQYYVGDEVVINGVSGTIIDFTLRTTRIRDFATGAIHIIPNGKIDAVENRSITDQIANVYIDVPNDYEPDKIIEMLKKRFETLEDERIIDGPNVRGISAFKDRYYTIFINTIVVNGAIYEMQRVLRRIITEEFKQNGIIMYKPAINLGGDE